MNQLKAALIGYGYWGRNIARVLNSSSAFDLKVICDETPAKLNEAKKIYSNVEMVRSIEEIPSDIDVVAIITPAESHYPLAKRFLERGKHILLTKPFTMNLKEAEELVELAGKMDRVVFVDHTFVFNPAVKKLKELLPKIGKPYFVVSQRLNLGIFQPDVNVIYDLMPHDLSILAYLFDKPITSAVTSAFCSAGYPQADLAHASFELEGGIKGLVSVSWLAPAKIRQFIVVGSAGMLSYDDVAVTEKVRFFDRGISEKELTESNSLSSYAARISYRSGDMFSPAIANTEALGEEMVEFAKAIQDSKTRRFYNELNLNTMRNLQRVLDGTKT